MEATIQSNNKAINIDINVSVNVGALKANIQRGLQDAWQAIKQRVLSVMANWLRRYCSRSAIDASITALASSQHSSLFTLHSSLKLSLPRLYRMVLHVARAMARVIDEHPTISNVCLWLMGLAFMVEVFLYA